MNSRLIASLRLICRGSSSSNPLAHVIDNKDIEDIISRITPDNNARRSMAQSDVNRLTNLRYTRLLGSDWFRLLIVSPGKFELPLVVNIGQIPRDLASFTYEALSYSWRDGQPSFHDETNSDLIVYNDMKANITRNLAKALRHVRYQDKPRVIWVDALCIN
ncbi:hypothetical protein EJ04DRAFT_70894 [Polyplosphaeria fusca]|uniref:Heterokaryon incompatibility domain-containing protein n=1 Tax=Polyplosphaeria fusca TaxID=682080 RepID=A0A9P4V353_9PLEO|nr:hypothetical protein EJ04DRAFT_70894 [Polyplosphaeria fusca]